MASLKNEYHIIPDINGGWSIKKSGSPKKLFHFKTKHEAIHKATKIGKKNKCSVVIHKKDGSVQEEKILNNGNKSHKERSTKIKRTYGSAKGKVHMVNDFDATYDY